MLRPFVVFHARLLALIMLVIAPLIAFNTASAACITNQQTCSSGYGVNEAFFGTGGELHACGSAYCAKQSAGETGVGNTTGAAYQAQAGFNTDRYPSLTFCVYTTTCGDKPAVNAGTLTAGTTVTGAIHFSIKTYLAGSYQIVTNGTPPTNGSYALSALTTATASNSSQEQFGINLVANTAPSVGANAVCATAGFCQLGTVTIPANYGQANKFTYNNGDTIASSSSSTDTTIFTVSYLFNTTSLTRGGTYTMAQSLVATSTF